MTQQGNDETAVYEGSWWRRFICGTGKQFHGNNIAWSPISFWNRTRFAFRCSAAL